MNSHDRSALQSIHGSKRTDLSRDQRSSQEQRGHDEPGTRRNKKKKENIGPASQAAIVMMENEAPTFRKKKHKNKTSHKEESPRPSIGLGAIDGNGVGPGQKESCLSKLLRYFFMFAVVVAYFALVGYLLLMLKALWDGETPSAHEACKVVFCSEGRHCVMGDKNGELQPRCRPIKSENAKVLEIVLIIMVSVPAALCIPCTLQWFWMRNCRGLRSKTAEWERQHRIKIAERGQEASRVRDPRKGEELPPDVEEGIGRKKDEDIVEDEEDDDAETVTICGRFCELLLGRRNPDDEAPSVKVEAPRSVAGKVRAFGTSVYRAFIEVLEEELADIMPQRRMKQPTEKVIADEEMVVSDANALPSCDIALPVADQDDDMSDLFAPTQKKRKEQAKRAKKKEAARSKKDDDDDDDDWSELFAPRKVAQAVNCGGSARTAGSARNEASGSGSSLGGLFAKAPRPNIAAAAQAEENSLVSDVASVDDIFHRPAIRKHAAERELPPEGPSGVGTGNESEAGLSALFAVLGGSVDSSKGGLSGGSAASSKGGSGSQCSGSSAGEDVDEDDDEDAEEAVPCNFFGFALRVAHFGEEISLDDDGMDSVPGGDDDDTESLLGNLVSAEMPELFHRPLPPCEPEC